MAKPVKRTVRVDTEVDEAARPTWTPSPEAKKQATQYRIIAGVLWALAIVCELVAIFWVLQQSEINLILLIVLILVTGGLAIGGSLLWKKANRLDPASEKDKVRYWVQNQLGAIITIIAFLPLIVLILANKDLSGKEKGIAAGIAGVVLVIAALIGYDFDPPSSEQYDEQTQLIVHYTGEDLVFWTRSGSVYHLCAEASAVNRESADNQIYSGTVAQAQAEGKSRLTLQVAQEFRECGLDMSLLDPDATPTAAVDSADNGELADVEAQ